MPLPIDIVELINGRVVESARIEYKRDWNPETILRTICAFANDIDNWGGGYIIVGVEEENGMPKLPVTGLDKSTIDKIDHEIVAKCSMIEPRYIPIVEHTSFGGAEIVVIWAPGGADRPYKCPTSFKEKSPSAYYIRKAANTIKANPRDERERRSRRA